MGDLNKKIAEYENRIGMLSQEIERLNGALRGKVNEIEELQR